MERRRRTAAAVIAAAALAVPVVALAGHSAEVVGVYEPARCAGSPCDPERDPAVDNGAVVDRSIQMHASAESDLPFALEWVRLEGRIDGDPRWICLQHWTTGTTEFYRDHYDWDTVEWPDPAVNSDCLENAPHYHGVATSNGLYHIRAVARSRQTGGHGDATSEAVQIRINNPPAPPVWVGDPRVLSDRTVELRFEPNTEPDMVEYVIERTGPADEATYAIDAARPGNDARMPCSRLGDIAYRCTDRDVGEARAGEYRYAIVARRRAAAGSTRCSVASGNCIGSAPGEARTVSIPRRGQTPASPPERSPGEDAAPDAIGPTPGETAATSPAAATRPSVSGPPGSSGDQNPVVLAVAAGLLTAVGLQLARFRGARG